MRGKWSDVTALFEKGGLLEGRWGWLEVLRQARWNDVIQFDDGTRATFNAMGCFLRIHHPGYSSEVASAIEVGQKYDHYRLEKSVPETGAPTGEVFETDAWTRYDKVRVDLRNIDVPSLALDSAGILTGGVGDDLAKAIGKRAAKALDVMQNIGGTGYGVGLYANKAASGDAGVIDTVNLGTDVVSLVGGPLWNLAGIVLNLLGAVSYGP